MKAFVQESLASMQRRTYRSRQAAAARKLLGPDPEGQRLSRLSRYSAEEKARMIESLDTASAKSQGATATYPVWRPKEE